MNTKQKTTIMLLTAAITASAAFAAEKSEDKTYVDPAKAASGTEFKQAPPLAMPKEVDKFKWGGDIRLREVYFDNIPGPAGGEVRGGANHFQRYRTRVYGEYHQSDTLYVRARLVNEWRTGQAGVSANGWKAFDETIFDNLFIDWKTDLWDIRLGRQDMIYGTGKVILDGTPLDGSRTIYFDAAKAVYKGIENTAVDFIAMYTQAQDPFALHSQDRDLVGRGGSGYTGAEAGGGVYIKNKTYEDLPWEAYYIAKTKEDDITNPGNNIPDQINTVGTRLMPKWDEGTFDGNLEMAYQSTPDTDGFMVDALVSWHIEGMEEQKARLGTGWYHLSEDWNPIFARWPQYSELYVYGQAGAAGRWANISMPHIDFSISPMKNYKADFLLGYMFAPQDNGPGGGHNRGLLFTWWNRFTIK
ncbi:MAG: hypothetical protein KAU94_10230, partial [Verrucomicrobia bacterium]|nr:hypothetical protein [Verrucomicrobiota bacterium]